MNRRSLGERLLIKAIGAILGHGLVLLLALGARPRPAAVLAPVPSIAQAETGPLAEAIAAAHDTCESVRQLCLAACPLTQTPERRESWNACEGDCATCAR